MQAIIVMNGTTEEIAALALAVQERQCTEVRDLITQEIQDQTGANRLFQ